MLLRNTWEIWNEVFRGSKAKLWGKINLWQRITRVHLQAHFLHGSSLQPCHGSFSCFHPAAASVSIMWDQQEKDTFDLQLLSFNIHLENRPHVAVSQWNPNCFWSSHTAMLLLLSYFFMCKTIPVSRCLLHIILSWCFFFMHSTHYLHLKKFYSFDKFLIRPDQFLDLLLFAIHVR